MKKVFNFSVVLALLSIFTSCATKIYYDVTRPAELDLNGAKTISVLPIKPYEYFHVRSDTAAMEIVLASFFGILDSASYDERRAIDYLQTSLEKGLIASPYIDVVSSESVQNAIARGYINPADVYLTGEITYYNVRDRVETEKVEVEDKRAALYDSEGRKQKLYTYKDYYYREVTFDFRYQIVDSSNNRILSYEKVSYNNYSGRYSSQRDLPSPYSLMQNDLNRVVNRILKEVQPYVVTRSVSLLEDKGKDPDMKNANQLAKDHNYKDSYKLYSKIYNEKELFEAGYNAAVIQQAFGNFTEAEEMMSELYEKTYDSRASKALSDIRYEINQAKRFQQQTQAESDYLE